MSRRSVFSNPPVPNYERCYFDVLNRQQWKTYANLGSVLDAQLLRQGKTTRCTQTNWKWQQMAARWRHAKIVEACSGTISDQGSEPDKKALLEKMVRELKVVRALTPNDKSVDTLDLDFDPSDILAEYTCQSSLCYGKFTPVRLRENTRCYAHKWIHFVESKRISTQPAISQSKGVSGR
ncbi:hypothetical protein BsWGS_27053 [Bradybaena similaris]